MTIDAAITLVISQLDNISSLKEEQSLALKAFLRGKAVFGLLPTGFGKSLIYQLAPLVAKELGMKPKPILIVVSPLTALVADQIKEATNLGLYAAQLVDNAAHTDILDGRCQLVFGSPETWLLEDKWRDMLSSQVYRENLLGIVVDEVHVAYKW